MSIYSRWQLAMFSEDDPPKDIKETIEKRVAEIRKKKRIQGEPLYKYGLRDYQKTSIAPVLDKKGVGCE